ncbi:MAG: NADH-quinone oxidoreductase subunit L [Acidobacteriales bacterium]|nr:NADH-quinone oxidoreductase subunit L [Terriglobales bacterium]
MTQNPNLNLWLIPLLPLAGAALNGLFGARFPKRMVTAIAWIFPGLAFLQALWITSKFSGLGLPYIESHGAWVQISSFTVDFGFYLDQLSLVMLLVVTGVGFLIHIYSAGYMWEEGGYYRFFAYLNLFMFFMLMLILANNYLLMFVGWEGVGLASYLLIGFYFLKHSASQAGKKAFIVNRIGDFAFLLGMFLLIKTFGAASGTEVNPVGAVNVLDFTHIFSSIAGHPEMFAIGTAGSLTLTIIAFCMMFGATGKSAQIPLYTWLPDAMEGPTPVSALIHAATMVTAGIYMVARSSIIFDHAPAAQAAVAVIGAVTAIFAASIGITQFDIKRVLAYSTVSQLGYMFMACGVAAYSAAIFHLMTHAFFKALLFLSAGAVIHSLHHEQDMRNMGGLRKKLPITFAVMLVGTIAIAGIPPFAGFFSKDEILWKAYSSPHGHWALWLIGIITALMTSFYMFRMLFMTFLGERREAAHGHEEDGHGHDHHEIHESPWVMLAPLVILAALSIVGGWYWKPAVFSGENKFDAFLSPVFEHKAEPAAHMPAGGAPQTGAVESHDETALAVPSHAAPNGAGEHGNEELEHQLAYLSVAIALMGLGLAYLLYVRRPELPARIAESLGGSYKAVYNKYYVDEAYQAAVVDPIVDGSTDVLWKGMDVGVIDGAVNGAGTSAKFLSDRLRRMQSGNIRSYAVWVALGAAAVLAYMIYMGVQ